MYKRLCNPMFSQSFFLFGPRGVGKTWLLRELFQTENATTPYINLLKESEYLEYLANPGSIAELIPPNASVETPQWIIIDEVQKVPALLSEVHDILESPKFYKKVRFALTGSSARKLKRGSADLLSGRALVNNLYPLSSLEVGGDWSLSNFINWGSLPALLTTTTDEQRAEILRSYVSTYIKEEIKEEQIVRKLEPFIRFLEAAAQANGELIVYSRIGNAALVDEKAVNRYFEILEDTLIGFFLPPYTRSARERALMLSKFYFFDIGVKKAISKSLTNIIRQGSSEWGKAFEHHIILECQRLNAYLRKDATLSHLRTKDNAEIDLIIELPRNVTLCVEIKSSKIVPDTEVNKLKALSRAVPNSIPLVVYDGERERTQQDVKIVPWEKFLQDVWVDSIYSSLNHHIEHR